MSSLKDMIKDSLKDFADPMAQAVRNAKDSIADSLEDANYERENTNSGANNEPKKKGCLGKVVLTVVVLYLMCLILAECGGSTEPATTQDRQQTNGTSTSQTISNDIGSSEFYQNTPFPTFQKVTGIPCEMSITADDMESVEAYVEGYDAYKYIADPVAYDTYIDCLYELGAKEVSGATVESAASIALQLNDVTIYIAAQIYEVEAETLMITVVPTYDDL